MANEINHLCYISLVEPKSVKEAFLDKYLIMAMQEELDQFAKNDV